MQYRERFRVQKAVRSACDSTAFILGCFAYSFQLPFIRCSLAHTHTHTPARAHTHTHRHTQAHIYSKTFHKV